MVRVNCKKWQKPPNSPPLIWVSISHALTDTFFMTFSGSDNNLCLVKKSTKWNNVFYVKKVRKPANFVKAWLLAHTGYRMLKRGCWFRIFDSQQHIILSCKRWNECQSTTRDNGIKWWLFVDKKGSIRHLLTSAVKLCVATAPNQRVSNSTSLVSWLRVLGFDSCDSADILNCMQNSACYPTRKILSYPARFQFCLE